MYWLNNRTMVRAPVSVLSVDADTGEVIIYDLEKDNPNAGECDQPLWSLILTDGETAVGYDDDMNLVVLPRTDSPNSDDTLRYNANLILRRMRAARRAAAASDLVAASNLYELAQDTAKGVSLAVQKLAMMV